MPNPTEIDTSNRFFVGAAGDSLTILRPVTRISREDALNLAAWLVAIADPGGDEFEKHYAAIINT